MIIVNREKRKIILNEDSKSHNFDTYPYLVSDFNSFSDQNSRSKTGKRDNSLNGEGQPNNIQIKLFLTLDKDAILSEEVSKIDIYLERTDLKQFKDDQVTVTKSFQDNGRSSQSSTLRYSRTNVFGVKDVSSKGDLRSSRSSANFVSKCLRTYSSRSKEKIIEKMNDEKYRHVGVFSFDDTIDSSTTSKLKRKDITKKELFGERKIYTLERRDSKLKNKSSQTSGLKKIIDPVSVTSFLNDNKTKELDISHLKNIDRIYNSPEIDSNSLQGKISSRIQNNFVSNDEAFKLYQQNNFNSDIDILNARFEENDSRLRSTASNSFFDNKSIIASQFAGLISSQINGLTSNIDYVIQERKQTKKIDLFSQVINVNKTKIENLTNGNDLTFTFKARNSKGRIIDTFSQSVDLKNLRSLKYFPGFEFEVSGTRSGSNNLIKIKSREIQNEKISFVILRKIIKNAASKRINTYTQIAKINPGFGNISTFKDRVSSGTANYRVFALYDDVEFHNFKSVEIKDDKRTRTNVFIDDVVDIFVENTSGADDSMKIEVSNVSRSIRKITVVKRNLSKRERFFSQVKSFSSNSSSYAPNVLSREKDAEKESEINSSSILQNAKIFLTQESEFSQIYTFFDNDVEDGEVYEYKALLSFANGESRLSSTSAIEIFERKSGLIDTNGLRVTRDEEDGFKISGIISNKTSEIGKIFETLDTNKFELFKDDLDQLRSSVSKNMSIKVEAVNQNSFETIELGEFDINSSSTSSKEINDVNSDSSKSKKNINISLNVPKTIDDTTNSRFKIKITPLILADSDLITQVNEKITELALSAEVSGDQSFRLLNVKKRLEKVSGGFLSSNPGKLSTRDYLKKGRIISPGSKSRNNVGAGIIQKESTGDIKYFNLQHSDALSSNRGAVNLTFSSIRFLKPDDSILKKTKQDLSVDGIINISLLNAKPNIDFISLHSVSKNGMINNHGLIFNKSIYNLSFSVDSVDNLPLNCYFKLTRPAGIYSFFGVIVNTNGDVSKPIHIKDIKVDSVSTSALI